MPSFFRAAFLTAITSAAGHRQVLPRHARRESGSRRRWPGARRVQRLPDIGGSGPASGALIRNRGLKFICRELRLKVATSDSPFTNAAQKGDVLRMPIAHGEGCYFAAESTLDELEAEDRVAFRYVDNANGSLRDIAGILNKERNVMGMMPHPERATEPLMGSSDGLVVFRSILQARRAYEYRQHDSRTDCATSVDAGGIRQDCRHLGREPSYTELGISRDVDEHCSYKSFGCI